MTIDDLKDVRLSEASRRYLGMYIKLCGLYEEATAVTSLLYYPDSVDRINEPFNEALEKTQDALRNLFAQSITEHLHDIDNHTEL